MPSDPRGGRALMRIAIALVRVSSALATIWLLGAALDLLGLVDASPGNATIVLATAAVLAVLRGIAAVLLLAARRRIPRADPRLAARLLPSMPRTIEAEQAP